MLETIRKEIHREYDPFDDVFDRYISEVQDQNLETEIRYLQRMNRLNVTFMSAIIEHTFITVVNNHDIDR